MSLFHPVSQAKEPPHPLHGPARGPVCDACSPGPSTWESGCGHLLSQTSPGPPLHVSLQNLTSLPFQVPTTHHSLAQCFSKHGHRPWDSLGHWSKCNSRPCPTHGIRSPRPGPGTCITEPSKLGFESRGPDLTWALGLMPLSGPGVRWNTGWISECCAAWMEAQRQIPTDLSFFVPPHREKIIPTQTTALDTLPEKAKCDCHCGGLP